MVRRRDYHTGSVRKIKILYLSFFLMLEEPDFPFHSTTITDEFPICSYHAMTGDDDDYGILIIGSSDSSHGFRIPDHRCLFEITASLSMRDLFECFPCFHLECCSCWCEGDGEIFSSSGKIFAELEFGFLKESIIPVIAKHEAIQSISGILFFSLDCFASARNDGDFSLESLRIREFEHDEMRLVHDSDEIAERR